MVALLLVSCTGLDPVLNPDPGGDLRTIPSGFVRATHGATPAWALHVGRKRDAICVMVDGDDGDPVASSCAVTNRRVVVGARAQLLRASSREVAMDVVFGYAPAAARRIDLMAGGETFASLVPSRVPDFDEAFFAREVPRAAGPVIAEAFADGSAPIGKTTIR